eukprot:CAMPEP_0181058172 /NCGR_PEP_ID=MMETSP1070-20121207/20659_1 /TAXON_ID=265543 /ORGANISM="Minutocellus polymorphus, Strain NH13" /LENGTH=168 /DNA_ID=CAMNT_0023137669 /DNA_START=145 /DNA_END=648 /DNA_ORIENTATION=+
MNRHRLPASFLWCMYAHHQGQILDKETRRALIALAGGAVRTTAKADNSTLALLVGQTIRSALEHFLPRPTAPAFGAVRTCTIAVHSIRALLINQAHISTRKLVLGPSGPRATLSTGTVGTTAQTFNSTLALRVGVAVRSALILVVNNLGALGAFESGRLKIAIGIVFA